MHTESSFEDPVREARRRRQLREREGDDALVACLETIAASLQKVLAGVYVVALVLIVLLALRVFGLVF